MGQLTKIGLSSWHFQFGQVIGYTRVDLVEQHDTDQVEAGSGD